MWITSTCNENLHNSANFFISNRNCLFIHSLILFIHLQSFVIHGDHLQCFSNLFKGVVQYNQVNMCRHNLKYILFSQSVKQRTGSFEIIERVNIQNESTIDYIHCKRFRHCWLFRQLFSHLYINCQKSQEWQKHMQWMWSNCVFILDITIQCIYNHMNVDTCVKTNYMYMNHLLTVNTLW